MVPFAFVRISDRQGLARFKGPEISDPSRPTDTKAMGDILTYQGDFQGLALLDADEIRREGIPLCGDGDLYDDRRLGDLDLSLLSPEEAASPQEQSAQNEAPPQGATVGASKTPAYAFKEVPHLPPPVK